MKLPKWTEEELTLTLDLYFKIKRGEEKHSQSTFREMSKRLRSMEIHPGLNEDPTFRNSNGISRKLVGFEINKGYYDNACKRLEDKTRILTLW